MAIKRRSAWPLAAMALSALACTTVTSICRGTSTLPAEELVAPPAAVEAEQLEPTPTSEPMAEAEATEPPQRREIPPTATPFQLESEDDPRAILDISQPSFRDSFDTPDVWFDYDTEGRAAYRIEEGRMVGIDYEPEDFYTWWTYVERQSGNVYAEITATFGDCIGKDAAGFVIRVDEESAAGGYGVEVACDGTWRFLLHRQGRQAEQLQGWTESDLIESGPFASNRIGLWGYAGEFFVFINNQQAGRIVDRSIVHTFGTFALYVRAHQTFDLEGSFDDFAFWHIPYIPE